MRDYDGERDRAPRETRGSNRRSGAATPAREHVPDSQGGDDQRDLLLRRRREEGEYREGPEPILVECPDRREQQWRRERDGMELVQRRPRRRRIEEVGEREGDAGTARAEMLAREQEHRPGAERERDVLRDEQQVRAGPDPPQRREQREHRVDVRTEPQDLGAAQVG